MAIDDFYEWALRIGRKVGSFEYSKRKQHKHLFNLAGVELFNVSRNERVDKRRLYSDSMDEDNG